MSGKRRRRRLSKKEYEQLERKEAQRELDARSESEDRQERIKVRWGLEKQERKLNEQKLKEQNSRSYSNASETWLRMMSCLTNWVS
jgi:hypothetical protein